MSKTKTTRDYMWKYQNVNPLAKLRPHEPYFFLRAQDQLSPEAVSAYADLTRRSPQGMKTFAIPC